MANEKMSQAVPMFEFSMDIVVSDDSGYYVTRWDRATPVTVIAADSPEAFVKAYALMGEARRGWHWTASLRNVKEAANA